MPRGYVERLPSGSLRVVVYAGTDLLSGKQRYLRSRTTKDEGEAHSWLGELIKQADAGRQPEARATVGHLIDQYMAVVELEQSTRTGYEGYIRRIIKPALGDVQLRRLRGPLLDRLFAQLRRCRELCDLKPKEQLASGHECRPMAVSTIRQIHAILSGAFQAAVRWEWMDRNPATSAKLPKGVRPVPQPPSPEDVGKLLEAAWQRDADLAVYIWLAATTGARRGELCGLRWNRVDTDADILRFISNYVVRGGKRIEKGTKTHQERRIAIDTATREVLDEHRERSRQAVAPAAMELAPSAYVFSNDGGTTAWNPDWTTHQVSDLATELGSDIDIKSLRHYTATQLLAAGVDIRNTAVRLGHGGGGATTSKVYAHPVESVDQHAADLLARQLPDATN